MERDGLPKYPVPVKTNYIYIITLVFILTAVLLLPFIKTDVGIHASGIVRPSSEVCVIRSVSSGRIKTIYLNENKIVKKDDVLLTIESEILNEQENFISREILQNQSFIRDINLLLQCINQPAASLSFENPVYRQFQQSYNEKVNEITVRLNKAKLDFERQSKLFREKVIAPAEFENFQFEFTKLTKALDQLKETERSQWYREHKDLKEKTQELESRLIQVQKEKSNLVIRSPLDGTIQNLAGLYPGSIVAQNQELGHISPDTSLIAVAYVSPGQIGLLHKDLPVRMLIDAFNHNQWGVASGTILEVPQDIRMVDSKPVFEVRCSLRQNYLELRNGYKGFLIKGMTLQAKFIVARRSISELIFDKVDDWLNPNAFKVKSVE